MTALIFEKVEIKSEILHQKVNNPHTTPVVDKVIPSIGDNRDKKDQNIPNQKNPDKIDNTENNLKKENTEENFENKENLSINKNNPKTGDSGDNSNDLNKGIQNMSLKDQSQSTSVGLPSSEEGTSRFVGLNDRENEPVDPVKLQARIEKLPRIIEEEKSSYIQDKTIEKYNSMTSEEYKVYCENNSTRPSTNPNIPQDKIINVVR